MPSLENWECICRLATTAYCDELVYNEVIYVQVYFSANINTGIPGYHPSDEEKVSVQETYNVHSDCLSHVRVSFKLLFLSSEATVGIPSESTGQCHRKS